MSPSESGEGSQEGLFPDADPPANSPDDLGYSKPYGQKSEPDRGEEKAAQRVNVAKGTIGIQEARKLVAWLSDQDFPVHVDVTVGHILTDLSGHTPKDFRWLCQAIVQAGKAPEPWRMCKALKARDVGILREEDPPPRARRG